MVYDDSEILNARVVRSERQTYHKEANRYADFTSATVNATLKY